MSIFEQFATASNLETSGIWLKFGDFQLYVARAGGSNDKYRKAVEQYFQPYRRAAEVGALEERVAQKLLIEAYADSIILGWRSKVGEDETGNDIFEPVLIVPNGETWTFSRDNVVKLFNKLPDFFNAVKGHCENYRNFRSALLEADAKN